MIERTLLTIAAAFFTVAVATSPALAGPPDGLSDQLKAQACQAAKDKGDSLEGMSPDAAQYSPYMGKWKGESEPRIGMWGGGFGLKWTFSPTDEAAGRMKYYVTWTECKKCWNYEKPGYATRKGRMMGQFLYVSTSWGAPYIYWTETLPDDVQVLRGVWVTKRGCYEMYGVRPDD